MIPGIPDAALTPIGAVLFLLIVVILVLVFGLFNPRWVTTRLVNAANTRADDWKKLYETERERGDVSLLIQKEIVAIGETSARILEALPRSGDSEKVST